MSSAKTAILLANLGSPNSYQVNDVRKYLNEFLMDRRVIDVPYAIRAALVKGIIVPFRAPKSAAKYKTIWTEKDAPLIHISKQVCAKLQERTGIPIGLCMRYANPTPLYALRRLVDSNPDLREVVLVPLYPHYAMSSYETATKHVEAAHANGRFQFQLKIVPPYFDHPRYIDSLSNSIRPFLDQPFDHVLFSYHGLPERHIKKTDPTKAHCLKSSTCCNTPSLAHATCYRHQVFTTTMLVARQLDLNSHQFSTSFQSRLGADAWLKPYTAERLAHMPAEGIKRLVVVCPAFVSDCLETLEEIQIEGRSAFLDHGGEDFRAVPCLNDRSDWIDTLAELVETKSQFL